MTPTPVNFDTTHHILLIGLGYSGKRFLRVLNYLEAETGGRIKLAGVVDKRKEACCDQHVAAFRNLDRALASLRPSSVIIAVNEKDHFEVLGRLVASDVEYILCEKPLTRTLKEAQNLARQLQHRQLSLNLTERYSPVVDDFRDWMRSIPDLKPTRIQFFWGKHRVRDRRPTMGVMSEFIHPIDLIDYLFGFEKWDFVQGFAYRSDFAHNDQHLEDSVHCQLITDGCSVSCHSSFTWHERRRFIEVFLKDGRGRCFQTLLNFDQPLWDCDSLVVNSLNPETGQRQSILERCYDNSNFPAPLHQIAKLGSFTLEGLGEAQAENRRVDYRAAFRLQELLERIGRHLNQDGKSATARILS